MVPGINDNSLERLAMVMQDLKPGTEFKVEHTKENNYWITTVTVPMPNPIFIIKKDKKMTKKNQYNPDTVTSPLSSFNEYGLWASLKLPVRFWFNRIVRYLIWRVRKWN